MWPRFDTINPLYSLQRGRQIGVSVGMSFFHILSTEIGATGARRFPGMGFLILPALLLLALSACSMFDRQAVDDGRPVTLSNAPENEDRSLFGTGIGGDSGEAEAPINLGNTGRLRVGVNIYLWRAALDTLAFMPMLDSDAFGGVMITDWYADPDAPLERFKITVYVLDGRLRADAVRVSLFRQALQPGGVWLDSAISAETVTKLENAILTRARNIRIAELGE